MKTETQIYSDSVHKLLRGLRRDVPDYTEDDCKQRVPKSGRVCINVRPIYSEPVICFCPKYGCIFKRKIIGHVHDFLDLQTLKLTQVHQKNVYDGFWDVYDGPFKPSLSEERILEDMSEAGAAAGEPNKMVHDKTKKREKAMRKQLDNHAYDQPKLKRKNKIFDQLQKKAKPSIDQSTFKAEVMQLATSRDSHDQSGTSKARGDIHQRPIKANLEILTSLSLSYDNSDGSQKSVPAKLIHLAISWENNDNNNDTSKNMYDEDKYINKTKLKQQATPQLLTEERINQQNTRYYVDHSTDEAKLLQSSVTKVTSDHYSDSFQTIEDITQDIHKVDLAQLSDTGLTDNNLTHASKTSDRTVSDANVAEFVQQATIGQLIEDHSNDSNIRDCIANVTNKAKLLQRASSKQLIEDILHESNTKINAANVENKVERVHKAMAQTEADFVQLATIKVSNGDLSGDSETREIVDQSENMAEFLPLAAARVLNDENSGKSKTGDIAAQSKNNAELLQLAATRVINDDHSDAFKTSDTVVQGKIEPTFVELPYHLGITDISKDSPKTGIKSLTSFEHKFGCSEEPNFDKINASKTRRNVNNVTTENELKELQASKEYNAVGLQKSGDTMPSLRNRDFDEDQIPTQIKVADDSETYIFDSFYYQEETVGENVLITEMKHDKPNVKSDICQFDDLKHLNSSEITTAVSDIVEDQITGAKSAENHISEISNLQKEIFGDYTPITNVEDLEPIPFNTETVSVANESNILINDIIFESDSQIDDNSTKYININQDESDEFMMGIIGIYARGQQNYIIDNASTKCKDNEDADDNFMSGLFGIFTRSCRLNKTHV